MRIIDANKLLEEMNETYNKKFGIVPDNLAEGFAQVDKLVTHAPTIEAEPVVHGKWAEIPYGEQVLIACSECRVSEDGEPYIVDEKYNYCPNCGAKMFKESD